MAGKEKGWGRYGTEKLVSPVCIGHAVILGLLVGDGVCVCVCVCGGAGCWGESL